MTNREYLEQAVSMIEGNRGAYGDPAVNFERWAGLIKFNMEETHSPLRLAEMMIWLKASRQMQAHKDDNIIDAIGYALCWSEMAGDPPHYVGLSYTMENVEIVMTPKRVEVSDGGVAEFVDGRWQVVA